MIRIALAEYDPRWPEQFEGHRARIASALDGRAIRIEHIGSTSVPGLAAKPVVDILVLGIPYDDARARTSLEDAGYELAVDEPGHRMYKTPNRSAHVHLWEKDAQAQEQLTFRDRLRSHPDDRALYEHVKRELAKREWETREHYAEAKGAVVDTIVRRARGESSHERIEHFAAILLKRLPTHARVLEIGAGEGVLAKRLADAGHRVVALDKNLRSTFPIVETPFEAFEAPAGSFDCVAAQLVLHHAVDLSAALGKIEQLLKPGGLIAIDDYGWERSQDAAYREERRDLHTSQAMLAALRERFDETFYVEHGYVRGTASDGPLGFTLVGKARAAF